MLRGRALDGQCAAVSVVPRASLKSSGRNEGGDWTWQLKGEESEGM